MRVKLTFCIDGGGIHSTKATAALRNTVFTERMGLYSHQCLFWIPLQLVHSIYDFKELLLRSFFLLPDTPSNACASTERVASRKAPQLLGCPLHPQDLYLSIDQFELPDNQPIDVIRENELIRVTVAPHNFSNVDLLHSAPHFGLNESTTPQQPQLTLSYQYAKPIEYENQAVGNSAVEDAGDSRTDFSTAPHTQGIVAMPQNTAHPAIANRCMTRNPFCTFQKRTSAASSNISETSTSHYETASSHSSYRPLETSLLPFDNNGVCDIQLDTKLDIATSNFNEADQEMHTSSSLPAFPKCTSSSSVTNETNHKMIRSSQKKGDALAACASIKRKKETVEMCISEQSNSLTAKRKKSLGVVKSTRVSKAATRPLSKPRNSVMAAEDSNISLSNPHLAKAEQVFSSNALENLWTDSENKVSNIEPAEPQTDELAATFEIISSAAAKVEDIKATNHCTDLGGDTTNSAATNSSNVPFERKLEEYCRVPPSPEDPNFKFLSAYITNGCIKALKPGLWVRYRRFYLKNFSPAVTKVEVAQVLKIDTCNEKIKLQPSHSKRQRYIELSNIMDIAIFVAETATSKLDYNSDVQPPGAKQSESDVTALLEATDSRDSRKRKCSTNSLNFHTSETPLITEASSNSPLVQSSVIHKNNHKECLEISSKTTLSVLPYPHSSSKISRKRRDDEKATAFFEFCKSLPYEVAVDKHLNSLIIKHSVLGTLNFSLGDAVKDSSDGVAATAAVIESHRSIPEHVENAIWEKLHRVRGAIRRQVDYYFSDANYHTDRFLKSQSQEDNWIPLSLIASFNRIKACTTNVEFIIRCLQYDTLSNVDLSEDGKKLRKRVRH